MELALLIFIAFWIVAASVARYRQNKQEVAAIAPLLDMMGPLRKTEKEFYEELMKVLDDMNKKVASTHDFIVDVLDDGVEPIKTEAMRIYGASMVDKSGKERLCILPANDFQQFSDTLIALFPLMKAKVIDYIDITPLQKSVRDGEHIPTRTEKKEMGKKQGLHFLQMIQDEIATGKQKDVFNVIINKYKQKYELS